MMTFLRPSDEMKSDFAVFTASKKVRFDRLWLNAALGTRVQTTESQFYCRRQSCSSRTSTL